MGSSGSWCCLSHSNSGGLSNSKRQPHILRQRFCNQLCLCLSRPAGQSLWEWGGDRIQKMSSASLHPRSLPSDRLPRIAYWRMYNGWPRAVSVSGSVPSPQHLALISNVSNTRPIIVKKTCHRHSTRTDGVQCVPVAPTGRSSLPPSERPLLSLDHHCLH